MVKILPNDTLKVYPGTIIDELEFAYFVANFESTANKNYTDVLLTYPEEIYLDRIVEFLSHRFRVVFHRKNPKSKIFMVASQQFH